MWVPPGGGEGGEARDLVGVDGGAGAGVALPAVIAQRGIGGMGLVAALAPCAGGGPVVGAL